MFVRLLFWINCILILIKGKLINEQKKINLNIFVFVLVSDGYVRTYADEYYGRIRGSNQTTGVDAGIIFLIIFGCIVGGFLIFCILGTFILGFFDNGFRCPYRNISLINSRL